MTALVSRLQKKGGGVKSGCLQSERARRRRRRKEFVKIHLTVNVDTKKIIVSMGEYNKRKRSRWSDDKGIVSDICNNNNSSSSHIKKLLADGVYNSKYNFKYLDILNKDSTG